MPLGTVVHTAPGGAGGAEVQAPGVACAAKARCDSSVLASATPARSVPSPGLQVAPCSLLCVQSRTNLDVNPSPTCHTCYQIRLLNPIKAPSFSLYGKKGDKGMCLVRVNELTHTEHRYALGINRAAPLHPQWHCALI